MSPLLARPGKASWAVTAILIPTLVGAASYWFFRVGKSSTLPSDTDLPSLRGNPPTRIEPEEKDGRRQRQLIQRLLSGKMPSPALILPSRGELNEIQKRILDSPVEGGNTLTSIRKALRASNLDTARLCLSKFGIVGHVWLQFEWFVRSNGTVVSGREISPTGIKDGPSMSPELQSCLREALPKHVQGQEDEGAPILKDFDAKVPDTLFL